MGLLSLLGFGGNSQRPTIQGILGQQAGPNYSQAGPIQPTPGTGYQGGLLSGLDTAQQIYDLRGFKYDRIADSILQRGGAAEQAMLQERLARSRPDNPTTLQDNYNWLSQTQGQEAAQAWLMKAQNEINIASPRQRPDANEAKQIVQQDMSNRMMNELEVLVQDPENLMSPTGNMLFDAQVIPIIGDILQEYNPVTKGQAKTKSLTESLSNSLLQAMRGAQVGPKEQIMFNKQLPRVGMSRKQFMANFETTRMNIRQLRQGIVDIRNLDAPPQAAPQAPQTMAPPPGFVKQ